MLIQKEPAFRSSYLFDLLAQLPTGMFASVDIYIDPSGTHRPHYFVPFPAAMPWAATEVMSAGRIVPVKLPEPGVHRRCRRSTAKESDNADIRARLANGMCGKWQGCLNQGSQR